MFGDMSEINDSHDGVKYSTTGRWWGGGLIEETLSDVAKE